MQLPGMESLNPSIFCNPEFSEIFHSLDIVLRVLETTEDEAHPTRPQIHFLGQMRYQSDMSGWVRMTEDNQIRWHIVRAHCGDILSTYLHTISQISAEHGVPLWRSAFFHVLDRTFVNLDVHSTDVKAFKLGVLALHSECWATGQPFSRIGMIPSVRISTMCLVR